ncbi:MAG: hypothetical protein ACRBCT_00455 [Alphaproteobacteria bacterium]
MHISGALLFLLFLPALIALGHDVYMLQATLPKAQTLTIDILQKDLKLSDLGFIIAHHSPDTLKMLSQNLPEEPLKILEVLFKMKAVYIALAWGGAFFVLFSVLAIFGIGPFKSRG